MDQTSNPLVIFLENIESEWTTKFIRSKLDDSAFKFIPSKKWIFCHPCERKSLCIEDMIKHKIHHQSWFLYSKTYKGKVCAEFCHSYYCLTVNIKNRNDDEYLSCSMFIDRNGHMFSKFGSVETDPCTGYESIENYQTKIINDTDKIFVEFSKNMNKKVEVVNKSLFLRVLNLLCKFPVNEMLYKLFNNYIADVIILYYWEI